MWKTIAVVGAAAAIVGGAGTTALASSQTTTPTLTASSTSAAADTSATGSTPASGKLPAIDRLRRAVHVTWVTQNKQTKAFITHEGIRGEVTAVSASSISVKAADNLSQTYLVNASTRVRNRAAKAAGSIGEITVGDPVLVTGTGTTTLTAVHIVETKK